MLGGVSMGILLGLSEYHLTNLIELRTNDIRVLGVLLFTLGHISELAQTHPDNFLTEAGVSIRVKTDRFRVGFKQPSRGH